LIAIALLNLARVRELFDLAVRTQDDLADVAPGPRSDRARELEAEIEAVTEAYRDLQCRYGNGS
jgi:hypothetical protein